jgi:hypothetical protein
LSFLGYLWPESELLGTTDLRLNPVVRPSGVAKFSAAMDAGRLEEDVTL